MKNAPGKVVDGGSCATPSHGVQLSLLMAVWISALATPALSQSTSNGVLDRLLAFAAAYPQQLSAVVAEEHYDQWVELSPARGSRTPRRVEFRTLVADYALAEVDGEWIGYRDVFDVDGHRVRDRNDRLARLLADRQWDQMRALLTESARYNVRNDRVSRNVNVPTFAIQLLHPRYRARFAFDRPADVPLDGRRAWRVSFRERERPTIVKRQGNQDQPMRGTVWLDADTGDILRSSLTWEKPPLGEIAVSYGAAPGIDVPVPLTMSESYRDGETIIRGEATYSNVRQFSTSGRVLP